ncbi:MAG: BtpA/SgcQ family protein [Firmicutes bacterium]|nr:BtpA/SgcQ family protein [Bacillota bacterium]
MSWLDEIFGVPKVTIGTVYLPALPGAPDYDSSTGLTGVVEAALQDALALKEGGVDGLIFGNHYDRPWLERVGPETAACMARVVLDIIRQVKLPFGVQVWWDPHATLAVAKATGASFVRGLFSGSYAGEMGQISVNPAEVQRYRRAIDARGIKMIYLVGIILGASVAPRSISDVVKDMAWSSLPDALALPGPGPGRAPTLEDLDVARRNSGGLPVFCNTGSTQENVASILSVADGVFASTNLKVDNVSWKPVDVAKVKRYMSAVNAFRQQDPQGRPAREGARR